MGNQYHLEVGGQDFYIDLLFYHLLLCKEKNNIIAEYALQEINRPIGVSEYKLVEKLPSELENALPSVEDIEKRIKAKFEIKE